MNRRLLTLVIALVLVAAASQLAACSRLRPSSGSSAKAAKVDIEVEVVVRGVDPVLAPQFRVGDTVRIKDSGSVIGKIASVRTTPTVQPVPTSAGELVVAEVPDQVDIHVFVNGSAVAREDGYRFDGEAVWVNSELKLVTPLTYCQAAVLALKETGK